MKRYNIIFVILSILSTSLAESQSVWSPRSSGTNLALNDICWIGECQYEGTFFVVGDSGVILYSTNNGDSWNQIACSVKVSFKGIYFAWPDTGVAIGSDGSIVRIFRNGDVFSIDSRPDTSKPADLRGLELNDISGQLRNPSLWVCGDSGRILKTVNRGVTWRNYFSPGPPTTKNLNAIEFINFDAIYAVGDSGRLLRSPRSNVWESMIPPEEYMRTNFYGTDFLSRDIGFAVGDSGAIIATRTAGSVWFSQNSGCIVTLRDICFVSYPKYDIQIGWVVGDSGIILKTTDLGEHWIRQESGTQNNLHQVFALDENTVVAVGDSGTVLTTLPIIEITGPVFSASPTTLSFGKILKGTTKVGGILVTNRGVEPLEITSVTSSTGSFTTQLTSAIIPVSQNLEFPIVYTPTGDMIDSAIITFGGNFDGSPYTIKASGNGSDTSKCGWISQNPLSFIPQIRDIKYLGSNTFVAVGCMDSILHSTDNGEHWKIRQCSGGILQGMNAIASPIPSIGVAVGDNGAIIKTIDGGYNWTFLESRSTNSLVAVSFSSEMVGFAVGKDEEGNSTIHRTTDGGNTWSTQFATPGIPLNAVFAVNVDIAVAVGQAIYRTSDGGITWSQDEDFTCNKCSIGPYPVFNDLAFLNQNVGLAVGENGIIARTTDLGFSWINLGVHVNPSLWKIQVINESKAFIYEKHGSIYYTTDGVEFWDTYVPYDFKCISLVDSNYGVAVVYDILNPSDKLLKCVNGIDFEQIPTDVPLRNLFNVSFSDFNNGLAAGNGALVRTTNGGVKWTQLLPGTLMDYLDMPFLSAQCIDETTITAVCNDGSVIRTSDGGSNWVIQESGVTTPLTSVYFLDRLNGYCAGLNRIILHTTDGGNTWLRQQSPIQASFTSIVFANALNGIVVGYDGIVLQTSNGGIDWTPRVSGTDASLWGLSLNGEVGIAVGSNGTIIRTADGGTTWNSQVSNTSNSLNGISFVDDWCATAVGNDGTILRSTDRGITWNSQFSGTIADIFGVHFINNDSGTVVGENGTILRTSNGGKLFTHVDIVDVNLPAQYLLWQNYPNPFNPVTVIRYSLPMESKITLRIYNILGQDVATLIDHFESAGNKVMEWNARSLSSGVYFYRLETTSVSNPSKTFTQVKKMILLR